VEFKPKHAFPNRPDCMCMRLQVHCDAKAQQPQSIRAPASSCTQKQVGCIVHRFCMQDAGSGPPGQFKPKSPRVPVIWAKFKIESINADSSVKSRLKTSQSRQIPP
jgi:hypothetical protein